MTYHTGDETPVVHRNAGEDHDEPSLDTIDIAKQPGVTSDENSGATNRTEYCVPGKSLCYPSLILRRGDVYAMMWVIKLESSQILRTHRR